MNAMTEEAVVVESQPARATQPFAWLIRREFWENRALYLVPAIVCGLILLSVIISMIRGGSVQVDGREIEEGLRQLSQGTPVVQRVVVAVAFGVLAWLVSVSMNIVGFFYTLDSLHSERRDRSILFWKSLPISDAQTVLSKLFITSVGIAAICFVFVLATHLVVMTLASIYLLAHGVSAGILWSRLSIVEAPLAYIYFLIVEMLWLAPVYCWLFLVSAWAKRMTFLWAVLPPAIVALAERMVFGTRYFGDMLGHRFALATQTGAFRFNEGMLERGPEKMRFPANLLDLLDPAGFLANPYLWLGLVAAGGFVAAAIWLRRYREPL